jgi:hypothetical protein
VLDKSITKLCGKCALEKSILDFGKQKGGKHGAFSVCKSCVSDWQKAKRLKHADSFRVSDAAKYIRHRDKNLERRAIYYNKNKTEVLRKHNVYVKERSKNDFSFRIRRNVSRRITLAVKSGVGRESAMKLLGCDLQTFIKHIENQFDQYMSWDTYGKFGWHFDHIIPCAAFDLSQESQRAECFNYKNYQPLWFKDNSSKCDTLPNGTRARNAVKL